MIHEEITVQETITAARFVLRPCRKSDAGLIAMYAGDERVARGTRSIPHPLPPGTIEAMIDRAGAAHRTEDIWVIDGSAQGHAEALGLISLERMDRNQSEIFYWIAPAFWNTGLASEAVRALIAANPHHSKTIFAEAFQDNPGSARVLTNCGFDYLGDAEAFSVARNATVSTWTYTLKMGA
ncbi:GNAT family N-acetyltransferase [Loktanella sp. D2R18]|uniref:GNAT family N-acetyltransferase n=1 Tax=Rhodobacterales TaxID=204455 RepID=UPI000DE88CBE|nr:MULTISPECIES: GNAT family N-acetyltransferase [Rhodobacterales]MDO6591611.1 GNAT family N-acetyltransferase [Yoonia sp. 1_MG-2023]RBW43726.1 GNAT family N-acetyltransferase [Loktanella sp. D2R18]